METKMGSVLQRKWGICLCALLCTALWGSAFPCVKIGYRMFAIDSADTASVILFAGIRFAGAGLLTVLLGSMGGKKLLRPSRTSWGRIVVLAMFQTVIQYVFFYVSLAHTTGVKGSILNGTGTLFAILFACLFFRQERFTKAKLAGCIAGFAGMVIVNLTGGGLVASFALNGEGFMILAAVSYGFSSIFIKVFSKKDSPVMLSGYQFLIGGICLSIIGVLMGGHLDDFSAKGALLLLYMMFISAAAYSLWGILLKYNSVSQVAIFGFMTQVFGSVFSALFLDEADSIGGNTVLALGLVCLGIYLVNRGTGREETQ